MPEMVSTTNMIKKLGGMLGTKDLSEWETGFVKSLHDRVEAGEVTMLTDKQLDRLTELHSKHFGG